MRTDTARILIAGLSGDSGKTFVSCGLLRCLKNRNLETVPFKKGPDYIDPAWLRMASGNPARNLDTFMMDEERIKHSFVKHSSGKDIAVTEGNRGLFDGFDEIGTHSTAELAKIIKSPVIISLTVRKVTRTAAAIILGCRELDKNLDIAGVIINQVAGKRHEGILRRAIENETGIPVIGSIPRLRNTEALPSRHLGLVTPDELSRAENSLADIGEFVGDHVDIDRVLEIAATAPALECDRDYTVDKGKKVRIGYFRDRAFSFYYPENLEALEEYGAELIKISSIEDKKLPDIDALYIGGGFPETNINALLQNREMMDSVKKASESGMPIYAECGGLIYLGEYLEYEGRNYPLAGIFPVRLKMEKRPQGHGYTEAVVDSPNPFYKTGTTIKGHEFHYSHIVEYDEGTKTCMQIKRGSGALDKRDGLVFRNTFASYTHVHTYGLEEWATGMIQEAINYHFQK